MHSTSKGSYRDLFNDPAVEHMLQSTHLLSRFVLGILTLSNIKMPLSTPCKPVTTHSMAKFQMFNENPRINTQRCAFVTGMIVSQHHIHVFVIQSEEERCLEEKQAIEN